MRIIYVSPPNDEDTSGSVTDAMVTFAIEYLTRHGYSNTVQALQAAGDAFIVLDVTCVVRLSCIDCGRELFTAHVEYYSGIVLSYFVLLLLILYVSFAYLTILVYFCDHSFRH